MLLSSLIEPIRNWLLKECFYERVTTDDLRNHLLSMGIISESYFDDNRQQIVHCLQDQIFYLKRVDIEIFADAIKDSLYSSVFDRILNEPNPPLYLKRLKWTVIPNALSFFILAIDVPENAFKEGTDRWSQLSKAAQQDYEIQVCNWRRALFDVYQCIDKDLLVLVECMNTRAERYRCCPKELRLSSHTALSISFASLRSALSPAQQELCDCVWSENADLLQMEAARIMGSNQLKKNAVRVQWDQLSESEQQIYLEKARTKHLEQKQKLKWIQQQMAVSSKETVKESKPKKKRKLVKKARSAYNLFFRDQLVIEREKHPEYQFIELSKIISKRWHELEEESRAVYCQKMKEL